MGVKELLRHAVIYTSVPPISHIYRLIYVASIKIVTLAFKLNSSGVTIYLRRNLAAGSIVPGISDIDLLIISPENSGKDRVKLTRLYTRLRRCFVMLDPDPPVLTTHEFFDWAASPRKAYRVAEGKRQWRLLHGDDILAAVEYPDDDRLRLGYYAELQTWWTMLGLALWAPGFERVSWFVRHTTSWKAAAEAVKVLLAIANSKFCFSRQDALENGLQLLPRQYVNFCRSLLDSGGVPPLGSAPPLEETAVRWMIESADETNRLCADSGDGEAPLMILGNGEDLCFNADLWADMIDASETIMLRYAQLVRYCSVSASLEHNLDEVAYCVVLHSKATFSLRLLKELQIQTTNILGRFQKRLCCYVLTPLSALRVDVEYGKSEKSVLGYYQRPEFFLFSGRPAAALVQHQKDAVGHSPQQARLTSSRLNDLRNRSAAKWTRTYQDPGCTQAERLLAYWKHLQMLVISDSAGRRCPLTLPAIRSEFTYLGDDSVELLRQLEENFQTLSGRRTNFKTIPWEKAHELLQQIPSSNGTACCHL